jgi:hypothetical protein
VRRTRQPLLFALRTIIERTFDLDTGIRDLSHYIIGDRGLALLYEERSGSAREGLFRCGSAAPGNDPIGARTLLREESGRLLVNLYYPDRLIRNLEVHDPFRSLSDANVDDFATFIEELDHLLTVADRHRAGAEISLLELELHANVTKELVVSLFVARHRGTERLESRDRAWIRHHLFHKVTYAEEDAGIQARYRDATALAVRYLEALYALRPTERLRELRRFHRRTHHEKLESIVRG